MFTRSTRANDDSLNDSEPKLESLYHRNSQGMTDGLYTILQTERQRGGRQFIHCFMQELPLSFSS